MKIFIPFFFIIFNCLCCGGQFIVIFHTVSAHNGRTRGHTLTYTGTHADTYTYVRTRTGAGEPTNGQHMQGRTRTRAHAQTGTLWAHTLRHVLRSRARMWTRARTSGGARFLKEAGPAAGPK